MKTTLFVFVFLFVLPCQADEWTDTDTAYEAVYLIVHTIDWSQSRYGASHPEQFTEANQILGKYPTDSEVNRYFIATGLLHVGIAYALPSEWRRRFQIFTIVLETGVNSRNYQLGVKLKF